MTKYNISMLICPKCKKEFPIPRLQGKLRKNKHVKTIWCPFCKTERDMIEYKNEDFYTNYDGELI